MIKLETHCHSLGGSHCATSPNEKLIEDYVRAGYGGIVLTNHISEVTYKYQKGETHGEKVRFYFSLADNLREQLKPHGIKLFCGAEIEGFSHFKLEARDSELVELFGKLPCFIECEKALRFLSVEPLYEVINVFFGPRFSRVVYKIENSQKNTPVLRFIKNSYEGSLLFIIFAGTPPTTA